MRFISRLVVSLHVTRSHDSIEEDSVVRTLFKDFIAALEKDKSLDQAIIANLRNALVTQGDLSVETLKRALFPESSIPRLESTPFLLKLPWDSKTFFEPGGKGSVPVTATFYAVPA